MNITLNEDVCLKHKLTLQEFLIALAIKNNRVEEIIDNLKSREIIINNNGYLQITPFWSDIIDDILYTSSQTNEEEHLLSLAKQMRELFPEGKMHGTPYYYRCNNREISLKLKKFFQQYGNYSADEILDATRRFVASFKGEYRYMPLIKYFIIKNKPVIDENGERHIQEVSELASYLENKGEDVENDILDWTVNSRN